MDLNIIAHEAESDRACERCLIIENVCLGAECARADATDRNGGGTVGNIEKEALRAAPRARSEEHTSELQSLGISYAVLCLKKKGAGSRSRAVGTLCCGLGPLLHSGRDN